MLTLGPMKQSSPMVTQASSRTVKLKFAKKTFSYANLLAIVTTEGLVDNEIVITDRAQHSFQNLLHTLGLRRTKHIELMQSLSCGLQFLL